MQESGQDLKLHILSAQALGPKIKRSSFHKPGVLASASNNELLGAETVVGSDLKVFYERS